MPGTVLGVRDPAMNKTEASQCPHRVHTLQVNLFWFMLLILIGGRLLLKELLPNELNRGQYKCEAW